jgi:hypothetical protein
MVIAQALGEYAAVTVVVDAISLTWLSAKQFLTDVKPTTWLVIGAGLFLVLYLRQRYR